MIKFTVLWRDRIALYLYCYCIRPAAAAVLEENDRGKEDIKLLMWRDSTNSRDTVATASACLPTRDANDLISLDLHDIKIKIMN